MNTFIEATNKKERMAVVILKALEEGAQAVGITQCTDCGNYIIAEQHDNEDDNLLYCDLC